MSRRAYELLEAELERERERSKERQAFMQDIIDREQSEKDKLLDSITRIRRRETGMTETPRPEPREPITAVPPEIEELISDFDSEAVKAGLRQQVLALLNNRWTEERVLQHLQQQLQVGAP